MNSRTCRPESAASRRAFVLCCACAGAACAARAATPSNRNAKSLKDAAPDAPAAAKPDFAVAFCGIYCAACDLHLNGKKDGKKCKGCTHPSMESKCAVFACAKEKKIANCGLCDSFESCEKLQKHHEKPLYRQAARRTCAEIRKQGLAPVSAALKTRWTCKACDKLFPWNNTTATCPHCGKAVESLSEKDA